MSLHKRTLIMTVITLLLMLLTLALFSNLIFFNDLNSLEDIETRNDVARVQAVFQENYRDLSYLIKDWAAWDDSYKFIANGNEAYILSNLQNETFYDMKLSLILYVNSGGELVFGKYYNREDQKEYPIPEAIKRELVPDSPLWQEQVSKDNPKGIIMVEGKPLLLISAPITTSDHQGVSRGTLVMGRFFDHEEIALINQLTNLKVEFVTVEEARRGELERDILQQLLTNSPVLIQKDSEENATGYTIISDLHDQPALLLKVDIPRAIYLQGKSNARYLASFLLGTGIVFSFIIILIFERFVLRRLSKLNKEINQLTTNDDLQKRVTVVGDDELSSLATSLNDALEKIEQAQQLAEEANRTKGDFLANMSHEIRTPMNVVIGMSDLLLDSELNEVQHKMALDLRDSAKSLLTIINDILDFSKIEAGKLLLENIELNLPKLIEGTADLIAWKAHDQQLSIMTYISLELDTYYKGDPGRLRQIILNLLSNALKFTSQGEVILRVLPVESKVDRTLLRIEVQDTGIGLTAEQITNLFTPFTQADGSTTRKYGGTGLGLTICKNLVELMGGEIGVESQPDLGSTFWFTVELERIYEKEISSLFIQKELASLKVLLLEHNPKSQQILVEYMQAWQMQVTPVESGKGVLELLNSSLIEQKPYQLVIMDLALQDLNAIDLASEIRASYRESEIKIILLTDYLPQIDSGTLQQVGFYAYLLKPVKISLLYDCIATVVTAGKAQLKQTAITPVAQIAATTEIPFQTLTSFVEKHILLAEDNLANQMLATRFLAKLGIHKVYVCSNGQEAVAALEKAEYDLVFMDCQMPELDGFEATSLIRRNEGAYSRKRVPIVAMTANAMQGDREKCLFAGMDDYISKPIDVNLLRRVLETWL